MQNIAQKNLYAAQKNMLNSLFSDNEVGQCSVSGQRLEYYRSGVFQNLQGVLAVGFPVVKSLVGGPYFDKLTKEFIEKYPPSEARLSQYGAEFASFLDDQYVHHGIGYLAHVARLEWARKCVQVAGDAKLVTADELPNLLSQNAELRLRLHPAARWLQRIGPAFEIWNWHDQGCQGECQFSGENKDILVFRRNNIVEMEVLASTDKVLLKLIDQLPFLESIEQIEQNFGVQEIQTSIARFLHWHVFEIDKNTPNA